MMVGDDGFESAAIHMRVDLRRRDVRVPEQFLHHPEIRSAGKQMRGE